MFLGPSWINLARSMSDPGLGGLRRTQGLTQAARFQEPRVLNPNEGTPSLGLKDKRWLYTIHPSGKPCPFVLCVRFRAVLGFNCVSARCS